MKMNREMFEGKDYPTQWALNPSMYQNMSNDQVDWAALAQQWIKMKETVVPPAPPPPSLSNDSKDGGGEAPMDMDPKDDDVPPAPPAPNISGNDNWAQWSQWGQWNTSAPGGGCWEWSGVPPPGVTIGPDGKPMGIPGIPVVPPAPTISNRPGFNVPPPTAAPYAYSTVTPSSDAFNQVSGYWSGDQSSGIAPPGASAFVKGIRLGPRMPHMRLDAMRPRDEKEKTPEEDTSMTIDAAKRKQLPAWIRDGLEKMEREKHKAVERERQEILRKQELEARKLAEDEARAVLDHAKSKFDSDSEKETEQDLEEKQLEDDRQNPETSPDIVVRPRRSRFRNADDPEDRVANSESPTPVITGTVVKRSREEILQDVMLKVRRSLTEILLEVTNEEISAVCREVWTRSRAKAPAGDTPVASFTNTAPLAQITRKLGLGIYGDSNSESEEERQSQETDDSDSDLELKETLRRRQLAFKKTEEEIEARLAEEEEQELRKEDRHHNNSVKYENHLGNDSSKASANEKEINNEREASETQSSGGHTPRGQNFLAEIAKFKENSPSRSHDSDSNSDSSSTRSSSDSDTSNSSKTDKKRRKHKSRSRSRTRKSRSSSRAKSSRHKHYRSSSSRNKALKHVRDGKSRSSRSRSRKRSVSHSRRRSRDRKRSRSHSRLRSKDRKRSRSRSKLHKRSSRSYSRERHSYGRNSKRRSRSKSRERFRNDGKTRSHREGKKSAHRYRD